MADRRGLRIAAASAGALGIVGLLLVLGSRGRPQAAPDFVVPDLKGNAVRLSALRGKVVLVNFWATWCEPCRQEVPAMQRLYDRMRGQDFELLALSADESRDAVDAFVKEFHVTFPVLLDAERQAGDRYGVWGYPETFVVDRTGTVVERVIGPREWDGPRSLAQMEQLVAARSGGG